MRYAGVISGMGKKSLSRFFQQAAFDALDIDVKYEHWPTPPDELETRVAGLRAPSILGANVTIPHKEACLSLMDEVDTLVGKVGALNTILSDRGKLCGYNTDVAGFLGGLKDSGFEVSGCHAAIAGAGGAARAVVIALAEGGAASVMVVNRTLARAQRLVSELREHSGATELRALPDKRESWEAAAAEAGLLVNCTSLGSVETPEEDLSPVPSELINSEMLVYDLVYRPAETRLLRDAAAAGAATVGGLPMLIYQGAASFEIWTGQKPPIDAMLTAAQGALSRGDA
jgi:shikimate dehydrogenase